jgi:hypothetical protein
MDKKFKRMMAFQPEGSVGLPSGRYMVYDGWFRVESGKSRMPETRSVISKVKNLQAGDVSCE